jgi:hypothetical protein
VIVSQLLGFKSQPALASAPQSRKASSNKVAKNIVCDILAYFAEPNAIKRDEIAARQLHALRQHQGPREKKLRLSDVVAMFVEMKDHA